MKVFLLNFALCVFQVSFAQDGPGSAILKSFETRPLQKPEAQKNPMIVPVPVYAPVQQYPVQQYPPIQQQPMQQIPGQPYLGQPYLVHQLVPIQQYPAHYPQFQGQQYPQMHHPHHQIPQFYPQFYHGVPC